MWWIIVIIVCIIIINMADKFLPISQPNLNNEGVKPASYHTIKDNIFRIFIAEHLW